MQITKFGHSCVLLDDGQTKILFDPGSWSKVPDIAVDAIIITHKHGDHLDIPTLQRLLSNSTPKIITNTEVGSELSQNNIAFEILEHGAVMEVGSFTLEGTGNEHAMIHPTVPIIQNTGYLINDKIYHPGDFLYTPNKPVEFLFLPVVSPWSSTRETIDYVLSVKPKICLPIHDAILSQEGQGLFYRWAEMACEQTNTELIKPELNKEYEFSI